jgi:ATP-binding protein involved in chromosome partitioning
MFEQDKTLDFRKEMIRRRFENIDQAIFIASGKGGVGKSIVAATIAALMAKAGMSVGLLDADVYGPSSAFIFNVQSLPREEAHGLIPPVSNGVKVMSIDLFASGKPIPVSGMAAREIMKEILALTEWGKLDYMLVDLPPGTGDVMMALIDIVKSKKSSIVLTTPAELSVSVVKRVIELMLEANIPILGILENMSYMANSKERPLGQGGGRLLAMKYKVKFLGELPIDPKAAKAVDARDVKALLQTDFAKSLLSSLDKIKLLKV